jgi:hypothetical protein
MAGLDAVSEGAVQARTVEKKACKDLERMSFLLFWI